MRLESAYSAPGVKSGGVGTEESEASATSVETSQRQKDERQKNGTRVFMFFVFNIFVAERK
jgi:hypothetical protein